MVGLRANGFSARKIKEAMEMGVKWNLKKAAGVLMGCMLAGAVLAGCGSAGDSGKSSAEGPVKLGMLANMNISEQQQAELLKQIGEKGNLPVKMRYDVTYYDSLNALQMGIESGSVKEMSTYQSVADYLKAKNGKFDETDFGQMKMADSFCLLLRNEDKELLEKINDNIKYMTEDGTLHLFAQKYIEGVKAGQEPPSVPMEKVEGRPTLKVGVTGDLPPIDLVLANGQPAGYNTAVLAELGKRLKMNIEIVQVESGARAAALSGKTVDAIFWAVIPADDFSIRNKDFDRPKGTVTSDPYFKDEIVHLDMKK